MSVSIINFGNLMYLEGNCGKTSQKSGTNSIRYLLIKLAAVVSKPYLLTNYNNVHNYFFFINRSGAILCDTL